ncbi:helix-turn-helix domain-containing protein [Pontibacter liquoris]|uniref:helix-turn-helix domain-containing protein n=1 Tax=Pontibacter liquoris TaxID=2905677 RepID=UPI001FA816AE|nr:helix-turn-helix domain-containing protein [Pontibacter liquoris]
METGAQFGNYYKWLHTIIRDDVEPQKTLTRIISTINPQARIDFLNYLTNEHEQGVVEDLLEQRAEIGAVSEACESEGYMSVYSPAEKAFMFLCQTVEKQQALFSNFIPQLLEKLKMSVGEARAVSIPEEELVFDDNEEYLTTEQAEVLTGFKKQTILLYCTQTRSDGSPKLPYIKLGKENRYKRSDLKKLYRRGSYRNEKMEMEVQQEFGRLKKMK